MTKVHPRMSWRDTVLARRPRRRRQHRSKLTQAVTVALVLAGLAGFVAALVYFFAAASPALTPEPAPTPTAVEPPSHLPTLPPLY